MEMWGSLPELSGCHTRGRGGEDKEESMSDTWNRLSEGFTYISVDQTSNALVPFTVLGCVPGTCSYLPAPKAPNPKWLIDAHRNRELSRVYQGFWSHQGVEGAGLGLDSL